MTLILAFGLMLLIVAAMAVGVMFGREPISGSCGGMKKLGLDVGCEVCGGNPALCETNPGGSGSSGVSSYQPDDHHRA